MRTSLPFYALGAAAIAAMLVACAGGSPIAPTPVTPEAAGHGISVQPRHLSGYYSCPKNGAIEYVSDSYNNVINIYVGKFAGQNACGQIVGGGLNWPYGLYVDLATHDLYVANLEGHNVLVYHKGQTAPYNTYTDPNSEQLVLTVALAKDGTVIATNSQSVSPPENGSFSTWKGGPNGGTFVGNFPMTNDQRGLKFTIQRNGTIFYLQVNDQNHGNLMTLWKVLCPAGVCGLEKQVPNVSFYNPDGILFDDTGDLLVGDSSTVDTFELPNPQPSTYSMPTQVNGMALDTLHQHFFNISWACAGSSCTFAPSEYTYPSFAPIGTAKGNSGGGMFAIAVDP
jgi:hypothetical protein